MKSRIGFIFICMLATTPAIAQSVKITPLGSHPGDLCANDRAIIFEDPTGVRFLYDAAHNVTGGDDPRLGNLHLVLLSHMHGDHLGDQKLKAPGAGTCANSERVASTHSTTAEVAATKNAALVMTRAIGGFVGNRVQRIQGENSIAFCPQTNGVTTVPVKTVCRSQTDLGGVFIAKAADAEQGVEITIVYASHVNNAPPALLSQAQQAAAAADGAIVEYGPPTGFVVKFTNGLTAYLSGDTGIHSEMKTIVNEYHRANLAVLNLGGNPGIFFTGAHAMNELVKPASVILTHPNEPVTEGGKLLPASRTATFMQQLKPTTHLAISGRTMEFDGTGRCVAGC
ncbi:MBL fold metallo-hydrolase [uncultured Halopseudomonas sp.]|uniref:MBL fold metallo-hydrolase n=1 Tax=uncultured Halopseudomonas sp. TaxID=2901193 RepID=UPI0030ED0D3A|tara:strand:- start:136077 stop:137096 length:1020 start_codon:yes stop_codon:yes gene_type:complete